MATATNPLLKSLPISNPSFTNSLHTPSIFTPKSLLFPNASKPSKLLLSLSYSLKKPTFSFITNVAQTSDWDQDSPNAVLEQGSESDPEDLGNTEVQVSQSGEESDGGEGLQEPSEEAKLYVGNLPFDVDSEKLAQIFEAAGVVEISEVIYNRETDRSRGFGFVTMSTVEEAEKAVEMFNRYDLNGRLLVVNKAAPRGSRPEISERPPREFAPSFRIYVGNLPWDVDNGRLEQVFSEHGKVLSARVMSDRETGRSRGFGFVTMASESEMNDAIAALDGQSLEGRSIRVNVAEERPRRNF